MTSLHALLVQKSYARCSKSKDFFDDFYDDFLSGTDEIKSLFAKTSRAKKKVFIHNGLSTMLLYSMGSASSKSRLTKLAVKHGPDEMNIRPELYPYWTESLMRTISKHDPEFSPELDRAWRGAVQQGMKFFAPRG